MSVATATGEMSLTMSEAVPLGYALASRIAQDSGVRALGIKGPVLTAQGLREPRPAVDVDLLVDPGGLRGLESALADCGWHNLKCYDYASVLPVHSINLVHPSWPCELDLHHWFPGFLRDPAEVFDLLWERRCLLSVAEAPIWVVDPVAHAALAAANCLRQAHDLGKQAQLAALVLVVQRWTTSQLGDLACVVGDVGAEESLRSFLHGVGAPEATSPHPTFVELALWRLSTEIGDRPVIPWLVELQRTPLLRRPRLLARALWMTDQRVRPSTDTPAAVPGAHRHGPGRWRRLRRALLLLPTSLRELRSLRRAAPVSRPSTRTRRDLAAVGRTSSTQDEPGPVAVAPSPDGGSGGLTRNGDGRTASC